MIDSINGQNNLSGIMNLLSPSKPQGNSFADVDSDGDGFLDQLEVNAFVDDFSQKTGITVDSNAVFNWFDANADSLLDQNEVESGIAKINDFFGLSPQNAAKPKTGQPHHITRPIKEMPDNQALENEAPTAKKEEPDQSMVDSVLNNYLKNYYSLNPLDNPFSFLA
jgi:hypothetical protein